MPVDTLGHSTPNKALSFSTAVDGRATKCATRGSLSVFLYFARFSRLVAATGSIERRRGKRIELTDLRFGRRALKFSLHRDCGRAGRVIECGLRTALAGPLMR